MRAAVLAAVSKMEVGGGNRSGQPVDGKEEVEARITSYNVCYTKLLRLRPPSQTGKDLISRCRPARNAAAGTCATHC